MNSLTKNKLILKSLEDIIINVSRELIKEGCELGNWEDTRGTGDALIALQEVIMSDQYPNLKKSSFSTIKKNAIYSEDLTSWGEEVWDTAIAIIALTKERKPDVELIGKSVKWLLSIFNRGEPSWYSEPWETLWALIALYEAFKILPEEAKNFNPVPPIQWLLRLYDDQSGILVNDHYTAQLLIVLTKWLDNEFIISSEDELAERLQRMRIKSADYFIKKISFSENDELWTSETWANSLIIWGLADAGAINWKKTNVQKIIALLNNELKKADLPTEDRAFSIIALSKLYQLLSNTALEQLPEGILEVEKRIPDPGLRVILEHFNQINMEKESLDFKRYIGIKIDGISDFKQKPPFFTGSFYSEYYQLNINKLYSNIVIIILVSLVLAMVSIYSSQFANNKLTGWVAAIPIILGILATIAQLLDIHFKDWFKK
jgi:hypothetical protein